MKSRITPPRGQRLCLALAPLAAAALLLTGPAPAATLTVGPDCSLDDAIRSANAGAAPEGSGCAAGDGPDIIVLPADQEILFNFGNILTRTRSTATPNAAAEAETELLRLWPSSNFRARRR